MNTLADLYAEENEANELSELLLANVHIPLTALNRLAQCCQYFYALAIKKLTSFRIRHDNLGRLIAPSLQKKMINYPIQFTGRITKLIPVVDMVQRPVPDTFGFHPDEFVPGIRYALRSIKLLMKRKRKYHIAFVVADQVVHLSHFLDSAECPIWKIGAKIAAEPDHDFPCLPGRYLSHTVLPTEFNPIILGNPIVSIYQFALLFASDYNILSSTVVDLCPDQSFFDNITHLIVEFDIVAEHVYDWSKYVVLHDGDFQNCMWVHPIIGREH